MSAITTNSLNSNSSNDSVSQKVMNFQLMKNDMTREEIEKAAKEAFKKM
jgi:hypothetical protein